MASSSDIISVSSAGPSNLPSDDSAILEQRTIAVLAKPSTLKVKEKRELIDNLCKVSNLAVVFYTEPILIKAQSLLSFRHQSTATKNRIMDGRFCANLLYELAGLLKESSDAKNKNRCSLRADQETTRPDIVRQILKVVKESKTRALAELQSERLAGEKRTTKKIKQSRPQDGIPFNKDRVCTTVCPGCQLPALCWLEDPEEIKKKNAVITANNNQAVEVWKAAGCKGKKPANKRSVDQTLACFSYKLNCGGHPKGVGCYLCELQGGAVTKVDDPNGGGKRCGCEVCMKTCSVSFPRSRYNKIYLEFAEEQNSEYF